MIFDFKEKKTRRKDMDWFAAKRKYPKLSPMGDADKDGVANWADCRPFDKKKQEIITVKGRMYDKSTKPSTGRLKPVMKKELGTRTEVSVAPRDWLKERYNLKETLAWQEEHPELPEHVTMPTRERYEQVEKDILELVKKKTIPHCHKCGKEVPERTPYCPGCIQRMMREAKEKYAK